MKMLTGGAHYIRRNCVQKKRIDPLFTAIKLMISFLIAIHKGIQYNLDNV